MIIVFVSIMLILIMVLIAKNKFQKMLNYLNLYNTLCFAGTSWVLYNEYVPKGGVLCVETSFRAI